MPFFVSGSLPEEITVDDSTALLPLSNQMPV
jgi:hypothetical protein